MSLLVESGGIFFEKFFSENSLYFCPLRGRDTDTRERRRLTTV